MIEALRAAQKRITPCRPPLWAGTGHLQTLLGHLLPSPVLAEKGEVLNVTLEKESERIHTTYIKGESSIAVYLFHGLGGSADATYMQRTAIVARSLGHHVFINNHRGCGEGMGLATEPYHSGRAEDLSQVIAFGRKMLPEHRHIAIGFSLSANALLLLSAKIRAQVLPDLSICVNGPINLDNASIKLTQGLNKIYDKRFVLELKHYVKQNHADAFQKIQKVKDLREFDEVYTAPLGGFKNRADYYETCSAESYLHKIEIPTVMITAEDDPFVRVEDYKKAKMSSSIILHLEKHGGHMGYLDRSGLGYERWLDKALKTYLEAATSSFLSTSLT
jgi:predicted alpha/beta-fold hydrolase